MVSKTAFTMLALCSVALLVGCQGSEPPPKPPLQSAADIAKLREDGTMRKRAMGMAGGMRQPGQPNPGGSQPAGGAAPGQ